MLQLVWDDAAEAIKTGQFDDRENRHLSRSVLCVDQQGWDELNELLVEISTGRLGIEADSASRAAKEETDRFSANLVMLSHPTPKSAKQTTAPSSGTRKKARSGGRKATAKA